MGAHKLPCRVCQHLSLSRSCRVCHTCHSDALYDERHVLLDCSSLAGIRATDPYLITECSGVMAKLVYIYIYMYGRRTSPLAAGIPLHVYPSRAEVR